MIEVPPPSNDDDILGILGDPLRSQKPSERPPNDDEEILEILGAPPSQKQPRAGVPLAQGGIFRCPHCGENFTVAAISGQVVLCPHCNRQVQTPPPAIPVTSGEQDKETARHSSVTRPWWMNEDGEKRPRGTGAVTSAATWTAAAILLLCGGLCLIPFGSSDNATPGDTASTKIEAWSMAKQFVRDQLKSPSTASFGGIFEDYQDPNDCVVATGGNTYRVTGWVDAENSFGAKIRSRFVCELRYVGNGSWRCEGVVVD